MGQDPDAIRREIARTREGMADTVDALAYKGDVKARTKDKARSLANKPKDAILSVKDNLMGTVQQHTPDRATMHDVRDSVSNAPGQVADTVSTQARRAGGVIRENPMGLAIGGLALGFVAGLVIPNTRMEDERLGQFGEQLRDTAKEQGQGLVEQGKEVAQVAASAAQDAVKDEAPQRADDVKSSMQDAAGNVGDMVGAGSSNGQSQF